MEKPMVSIIIPHYNTPLFLEKLLLSIPEREDIEVIVVDDESSENLSDFNRIKASFSGRSNVTFLVNFYGKGAGGARNTGLSYAKGKWLLFADADDIFTEGFYETISKHFESEADVIYFMPESKNPLTGEKTQRSLPYKKLIEDYINIGDAKSEIRLRYRFWTPWSKLIRHSIVSDNNIRYDEIMYSNDVMFQTRVALKAGKIEAFTDTIYCLSESIGGLTTNKNAKALSIRQEAITRYFMLLKNHLTKKEMSYLDYDMVSFLRFPLLKIRYKLKPIYEGDESRYAGRNILSIDKVNRLIAEKIKLGDPFMVSRFGSVELENAVAVLKHRNESKVLTKLTKQAGFFPENKKAQKRFVKELLDSAKSVDLIGEWKLPREEEILEKYAPGANVTVLGRLNPWSMDLIGKETKPWTSALKGRKVLVIHPFESTIIKQYSEHREDIFKGVFEADDILPEFELKTLKAVQSIGGDGAPGFSDWFEALSFMEEQIKNIDFDVAILGCGAYGMPLAAKIKDMGKIAIHLGGATQLMFGIRGMRWEEGNSTYAKYIKGKETDCWVWPSKEETPSKANEVEGGCYWKN